MGPRAGPDRCGKFRLHRDSIPGQLTLACPVFMNMRQKFLLRSSVFCRAYIAKTVQENIKYDSSSTSVQKIDRSRWPRGLRRRSAAVLLFGSRVRIPPGAWVSLSCVCYVFSSTGRCDGPIPRPEDFHRACACACACACVCVCLSHRVSALLVAWLYTGISLLYLSTDCAQLCHLTPNSVIIFFSILLFSSLSILYLCFSFFLYAERLF